MDILKSLATFGVIEVTAGNALAISVHQYAEAFIKYIVFPLLKNFVDLNELKLGDMFIGKFIKETILFTFSLGVAFYLLNVYLKYVDDKTKEDDKKDAKKKKKEVLNELGINKKRLMYAMV